MRPFLEAAFRPRADVLRPTQDQVVCRCEVVTAGQVRQAVQDGYLHADAVKAKLRCGMGPCQGRLCATPVACLIAQERAVEPADVGPYRIRPPLKPITLEELAKLVPDASPEPAAPAAGQVADE